MTESLSVITGRAKRKRNYGDANNKIYYELFTVTYCPNFDHDPEQADSLI